jgi:hypothetical protein
MYIYVYKGVSPRAVSELFLIVESLQNNWDYTLTFSMLEIYNETILGKHYIYTYIRIWMYICVYNKYIYVCVSTYSYV